MFQIGPLELLVIITVAIIAISPQKLPSVMRQVGRFFAQLRGYTSGLKSEWGEVVREVEVQVQRPIWDDVKAEPIGQKSPSSNESRERKGSG